MCDRPHESRTQESHAYQTDLSSQADDLLTTTYSFSDFKGPYLLLSVAR